MTPLSGSPLRHLDGGAPPSAGALSPKDQVPRSLGRLEIGIVSDTICPWCYVGKRRIERAIDELAAEGVGITARWLPYELNPKMPAGGMDRRVYRSGKFGTWEKSQALDAQVAAEGSREGIEFRHDLMARTPNTRLSHRLIWLAGEVGGADVQGQVVEALFAAYFRQGRDIGDSQVLVDIGVGAGLATERVHALLAGNEGIVEVLNHEMWATSAGLSGVPSIVSGQFLLFSGAQRTSLVVKALREVAAAYSVAEVGTGAGGETDARA